MLLNVVAGLLCVLVTLGLWICWLQREWGTLIFAAVMFTAMGAVLIYGAAHTPAG